MRLASLQRVSLLLSVMVLSLSALAWGQQWQDVAGELMSPACPGRTLLNCTSGQAEQWRELIRQKLAQGESKEQIVQHFIDIGGEAILAAPPKKRICLSGLAFALIRCGKRSRLNCCLDSQVGSETYRRCTRHGAPCRCFRLPLLL